MIWLAAICKSVTQTPVSDMAALGNQGDRTPDCPATLRLVGLYYAPLGPAHNSRVHPTSSSFFFVCPFSYRKTPHLPYLIHSSSHPRPIIINYHQPPVRQIIQGHAVRLDRSPANPILGRPSFGNTGRAKTTEETFTRRDSSVPYCLLDGCLWSSQRPTIASRLPEPGLSLIKISPSLLIHTSSTHDLPPLLSPPEDLANFLFDLSYNSPISSHLTQLPHSKRLEVLPLAEEESIPEILEKTVYVESNGAIAPKGLIGSALRKKVESIDHEACQPGEEDSFFVADLGEVYRQHMRWKLNLPRVKPFYAVKCNPDAQVIRLLAELGTGFDCASKAEIEQVLGMGVDPNRIIYAQPCKTNSYVRYAASQGVKQMTFDNRDELYKVKKLFPDAELFLRIQTDDSSSLCRLSLKFGAALDSTDGLLKLAKDLGLNVVGVSFHVGSGASDPLAFLKAVQDARVVFDQAAAHGYILRTLDVGGGFCSETFDQMSAVLRTALDEYMPSSVNIIGEPGRYYVSSAFTLASHVIARRTHQDHDTLKNSYMIYLNDGLYGNFSSIMFDHQNPEAKILLRDNRFLYDTLAARKSFNGAEYSIWGPTCDGIDRITESIRFDATIDVGDWLYFENMGAYTKCSATRFNGFNDSHQVIYVSSELGAKALLGMA